MADSGQFYETKVIAQLFNVSVRRIQQLTQDGVIETTPVPGRGRVYELVPTIQKYVQYLQEKAYGKRGPSEKEADLREQKMKAEIALKESQGELHRLRTDIAAGKYISVEEVTLDYSRFFVTFKKFAQALPSRIVSAAGSTIDPLEARHLEKDLQSEVQTLLKNFVVAGVTELPQKRKAEPEEAPAAEPPATQENVEA